MRTRRVVIQLVLMAVLLSLAGLVGADPLSYQARLTDEAGDPMQGAQALSFSLYYQEEGGSAVWTEAHNPNLDSDGLFSVLLGEGSPLDSLLGSDNPGPAWFEITVDGTILAPRRRIAGAARAFLAEDARKLAGLPAEAYATDGHNHNDLYPTHLVLENSDGDGPNAGTPRVHWDVLHGVPATFVDGAVNWNELVGVPQGFADNVDDTGAGGGTLDAAYDYGGAGAGNFIIADAGPVHIRGLDCLQADTKITVGSGPGLWGKYLVESTNGNVAAVLGTDSMPGGYLQLNYGDERTGVTLGDGSLWLNDDVGGGNVYLGADLYNGGTFQLWGNDGDYVDFRPGLDDDNSVMLPDSSIASQEILDEPGIARSASGGSFGLVELPTDATEMIDILSVTITLPRSGYVLVRGLGTYYAYSTTAATFAYIQIDSTSGGLLGDGYQKIDILPTGAGTSREMPVFAEDVYYRQAGTHTFYFEGLGSGLGSGGSAYIKNPTLTALYLPTSYGTVSTFEDRATASANSADLRQLELRDARARAEAERARRELVEMRLAAARQKQTSREVPR
jgi:hypothetical protein